MKPSPPNRPTPIFRWNAIPTETPRGGAQERVLLADELAAQPGEVQGHDAAGVGGGKGHTMHAGPTVGEDGHEEALAGDQALAGAEQGAQHAALAVRRAAVAEHRLHLDARRHEHHGARFRDRALPGIELDLDELQVLAVDREPDLVRAPRARHRGHGQGARGRRRGLAPELGHVADRSPRAHPLLEHEGGGVDGPVAQARDDLVRAHRSHLVAADGHVPLGPARHSAPWPAASMLAAASLSMRAVVAGSRPRACASCAR